MNKDNYIAAYRLYASWRDWFQKEFPVPPHDYDITIANMMQEACQRYGCDYIKFVCYLQELSMACK